jgi:predicted lipoprotein with Yx(FWY)xxD motif
MAFPPHVLKDQIMNRRTVLGGVLAAALVAAGGAGVALASSAGSGSGGPATSGGGYSRGAPPTSPAASGITVMGTHTSLGPTLADGRGRTVYLFASDSATVSTCTGSCASIWPPVPAARTPRTSGGASAVRVGSLHRTAGGDQLTYNGHPLYYYAGDTRPGDTTGQGLDQFGATWYALTPSGVPLDDD